MSIEYIKIETNSFDVEIKIFLAKGKVTILISNERIYRHIGENITQIGINHYSHGQTCKSCMIYNNNENITSLEFLSLDTKDLFLNGSIKIPYKTIELNKCSIGECYIIPKCDLLYVYDGEMGLLQGYFDELILSYTDIDRFYSDNLNFKLVDSLSSKINKTNTIDHNFDLVFHEERIKTFKEYLLGDDVPRQFIAMLLEGSI